MIIYDELTSVSQRRSKGSPKCEASFGDSSDFGDAEEFTKDFSALLSVLAPGLAV